MRFAFLGVGSVGSLMASGVSRLDYQKILLLDNETLEPGNLVRHEAPAWHVERSKSSAMAMQIVPMFKDQTVSSKDVDIVAQWESVEGLLQDFNVIIDATASDPVHRLVATSDALADANVVWVYITPGPSFGVLVMRRPGSAMSLGTAEDLLGERFAGWGELLLANEDDGARVWPEPGCYDPTFVAPYHRIRLMCDAFLTGVLGWLDSDWGDYAVVFEQRVTDGQPGIEQLSAFRGQLK